MVGVSAKAAWQWQVFLTAVMLVGAIPGFILSAYSVNPNDEPYQILNGMDWPTAVYSPLSSWAAHLFGRWTGWQYLAFRHLALLLNFAAIYICAFYALHFSVRKKRIILWSGIITLLGLSFKTMTAYYGWDCWTSCGLAACIVLILEVTRRFSWFKLVILAVACGLTALLRIPNVCILIFTLIVLAYNPSKEKGGIWKMAVFAAVFTGVVLLVICLLYGSLARYIAAWSVYAIGDHSLTQMIVPFGVKFLLVLVYAAGIYACYRWMQYQDKRRPALMLLTCCLAVVLFTLSMLPSRGFFFGMGPIFCLAVILLSLLYLFRIALWESDVALASNLLILFLFPITAGIGSNGGYSKTLIWPVLPLIIWLMGPLFRGNIKRIYWCWAVAYGIYSIIGIIRFNFLDEGLDKLTYRFADRESVLCGMKTNPDNGKFITQVYDDAKPFLNKGYHPIVLKQGNDYIYEYMMKAPNKYQRHNFSNWYAFWDKEYVEAIERDIKDFNGPLFVVYRQWKSSDDETPMLLMLEKNTECVVDKPGYSIWVKE